MGYFALGAYYNYSTYGATGLDLIPWVPLPDGPQSATITDAHHSGIETSGGKCHTCFAMSWITSVLHSDRDVVVEADTCRCNTKLGDGGGLYSRFRFLLDYLSTSVCSSKAAVNII